MRAILRIEVEAVRFLKEEPHKLDSLLKRVRSMTDILTMLRRHVTEGLLRGVDPSQAVQYSALEKATAADALKNQEELKHAQGHAQQNLTAITSESQVSSVKSEVIPFSTMTVHHVQSSPVVIHQSQHSSALVNHAQSSPTAASHSEGVPVGGHLSATPPAPLQEPTTGSQPTQATPAPQVSVNGTTMQSLFIEEIHSASTRNRAVSIEKAEKKWEEKRQNLDHYNGKEFEKLLEEAQANIMKSIPNLEMPPQPAALPKGEAVEKLEVSEEVPDGEQDNDKLTKSPPPPPPRRSYLPGSGLTTTRSGDVIYAARKEAAAVKECSEDAGQIAQSKAPKEDQALSRSTGHDVASAAKDEEEEEGDKIMAELQAFQKCSFMDVNSNSHAEQSRNDTHVKDIRPGTLMHHKEKKGSSAASQTSRMPVPMASKTRQGSMEKAGKQHKLQDPRQYRQANGSAKKAGGDYKATSPTLPASKIPAFSPTSGKSSSAPASSGDSSNPLNPPTKTSIPSSNLLGPQTGRITYSTSLIPSLSNGSSKFQSPTYPGKGHHLSFSLQTQNGRPPPPSSSSTSPPSSTSPTSLNQGMKSIRTIHTPSFTSYKAQNGNAGKSTPSTAKEPS
uniref:Uncharacterized protein n=1 Tax=Accipiter nisus TaxID=211598 RepID=A0A8B9N7H8_9AVES